MGVGSRESKVESWEVGLGSRSWCEDGMWRCGDTEQGNAIGTSGIEVSLAGFYRAWDAGVGGLIMSSSVSLDRLPNSKHFLPLYLLMDLDL